MELASCTTNREILISTSIDKEVSKCLILMQFLWLLPYVPSTLCLLANLLTMLFAVHSNQAPDFDSKT